MEGIARIALLETLEQADKTATLAINSLHSALSDAIWVVFSDKEIWYPLYFIVLVFLFIRLGWKKAIVVTLACVLTIVACDQFANFTKDFFERYRPCWDAFMAGNGLHLLEGRGNYYGFYSAHAANAIGFAVCSALGFANAHNVKPIVHKEYCWFIVAWALLVGFSRIFVGKHFLGDVLVGFAVGSLFAWGIASLAKLAIVKLKLR